MSYLLFVDESGHDHQESPYYVLAGVGIHASQLWPLIDKLHQAEQKIFGQRVGNLFELKGKNLLKSKVYRLARKHPRFDLPERTALIKECLRKTHGIDAAKLGQTATDAELAALSQAKLDYVRSVLNIAQGHELKAFASIVDRDMPLPRGDFLRKDYTYLFERYYGFLDYQKHHGLIVFDELERSQCHLLINQMEQYFLHTQKGKARASRVIPEPFFVHSHLTTATQAADIIAYVINWGVRLKDMTRPARPELSDVSQKVKSLQYCLHANGSSREHDLWSFKFIKDMASKTQKGNASKLTKPPTK